MSWKALLLLLLLLVMPGKISESGRDIREGELQSWKPTHADQYPR